MKYIKASTYTVNPAPEIISDNHYNFITHVFHLAGIYEQLATEKISKELSFSQIKILSMIHSGICTRSSELALHFNVSKANMTGMVGRLERSGYLTRKEFEDDYRVKILELTDKGRDFIATNRPKFFNMIKKPLEDLGDEKVQQINETLSNCIDDLRLLLP